MMKSFKILSAFLAACLIFSSVAFAVVKPAIADSKKPIKVVKPPIYVCTDPAVRNFSVSKTLINNVATFTMTGQVCNNGPGNYNQPDNALQANFNVYAGYGPMFSYPASGDVKFFTQSVGTVLQKSQCKSFTQKITRDKVLQWGLRKPAPNEKQMKLLFEFFVRDAKGTLGTSSQVKSLDCNTNNNLSSQTLEMMIRIP